MKRSYQNLKMDPKLLDQWNPSMLVIRKRSLDKHEIDSQQSCIWQHRQIFSQWLGSKAMFLRHPGETFQSAFRGDDCNVLPVWNPTGLWCTGNLRIMSNFSKLSITIWLWGNVTLNQLGHFLILMTYMSFCRIGHYTDYMREQDAINLEIAVWMSIVIVAFRTSFHAEGAHRTINPYFNVLNTIIRRRLHVILTRYLEQECVCKNHVQCDISPNILTSEIILPSYEHFLHYILEKGFSRFSIVSESEILSKYGKTITMIVLARVNGYYSPYFPQSIMEKEAKCLYGTNFSFAERDFHSNKLLKENRNMSQEAINQKSGRKKPTAHVPYIHRKEDMTG